jgi:hypothetical protein
MERIAEHGRVRRRDDDAIGLQREQLARRPFVRVNGRLYASLVTAPDRRHDERRMRNGYRPHYCQRKPPSNLSDKSL